MRTYQTAGRPIGFLYATMLADLMSNPDFVTSPRGQETLEVRNVMIEHDDPSDVLLTGVGRKLSSKLAVAEALQLIGGFSDPKSLISIAPSYAAFADEGEFHGAYGDRAGSYFEHVVRKLKDDPDTRQANVALWKNSLDLGIDGKHDYPCTVYLNFAIRNDQLVMTTHMRSNDIWLGYPYDLFQFTALARSVAHYLGISCGPYVHYVDSLHLYERDRAAADSMLTTSFVGERRAPIGEGVGALGLTWPLVQSRARRLFYADKVNNMTAEEQWMWSLMDSHWSESGR